MNIRVRLKKPDPGLERIFLPDDLPANRPLASLDDARFFNHVSELRRLGTSCTAQRADAGLAASSYRQGVIEREVPVPPYMVGELARHLVRRGLDADPEGTGNQGACLLGKASDANRRVSTLSLG